MTTDLRATLATALAGRYEIDREIGRGGMATVYLARDVRHNRNVALKVLNPELGAVLGVERFLAEIQVTANLQHPNLLPLFDSGEANGLLFYVMPYVEGESLRGRLDREKHLPVDEALHIATAIAGALDYAHRHKVIHRDLKPENILLQEGQPLIADFGIALAVSNAGGARITQTGLSLGTPQYMSPEQASGDRVVDGRTDIYSLGAMTYEMLAGDPPHVASTTQAIIAKVMTEKPISIRASRPNVPPHVDAAIGHALEKLAADRFATAHEFADALAGRGISTAAYAPFLTAGSADAAATNQAGRRWRGTALIGWALAIAALVWAGWRRPAPRADLPVIRAVLDLPPNERVQDALIGTTIAVSPQGDRIAYTTVGGAGYRTYVRHTSELAAREVRSGTSSGQGVVGRSFAYSPDGKWLAFTEGNEIKKVASDGGLSMTIAATTGSVPRGLAWLSPDSILMGSLAGLYVIPAGGGSPKLYFGSAAPSDTTSPPTQVWPVVVHEAGVILFATAPNGETNGATFRLAAATRSDRPPKTLDLQGVAPLGVLGGQLVYVTNTGAVMAAPFDTRALLPTGEPTLVEDGVITDGPTGAKASLSPTGTLIFLNGRSESQAVLTSPAGERSLIPDTRQYSSPRFSPDGRRLAITVAGGNATDIWIYNVDQNTLTRLTTEGVNIRPEWTPDGKRVLFRSDRGGRIGIWWQPADGSGAAELLYQPDLEPYEALVSPDSRWLLYRTAPGARNSRDIFAVPLDGKREPVLLVGGPAAETMPRLSPDGQWLAYQSNEGGRAEVYVRPFPSAGARVQVSDQGGTEPVWARSGHALFYRSATGELMQAAVTTGARFSIGARQIALRGDYLSDPSHPSYDVAPDGKFLMLKRAGGESQTVIVHNWLRELAEKTAPKR